VLLTGLVSDHFMAHASGWIAAVAGGLLLHVVTHATPRVSATFVGRTADFLGATCGIALALVGSALPMPAGAGGEVQRAFGLALYELTLDAAPLLLAGFACGATFAALLANVVRPAWLTGVSMAAAVGLESVLVSVGFLGWSFAAILWFGTVVLGVLARPAAPQAVDAGRVGHTQWPTRPLAGVNAVGFLDELLTLRGPWIVLGVVAAAFAESLLPIGPEAPGGVLHVLGFMLLALLSAASVPPAVVLGSVFVSKGMDPALLLGALLLGFGLALSIGARREQAPAQRWTRALGVVVASAGFSWLFRELATVQLHAHDLGIAHAYAWPTYAATALLLALFVQRIWRVGMATWLSALWASPDCSHSTRSDGSACAAAARDPAH
jgi:hypothetical protein